MLTTLLLVLTALASASDPLTREVICAETNFSRAAERKDKQAFLELVDSDARFVTGSIARGKDEIAEAWAGVFEADGPQMRWRPRVIEVTADGMLALSRGPYRVRRRGDDGEITDSWGHYISTWRRTADGRWLIVFDTGGDFGITPSEADIAAFEAEPECPE